ncbi:actin binding Rho activating protein b [Thalassophryne amazonica]|uniref:actin binding Rho activating protein b n=1 Tax=Thalassophryne amazonica TaxID=390379 RepID=UPI001470D36C|nr:actin binding Rho activating protein b [Thalassophryne amazonica]
MLGTQKGQASQRKPAYNKNMKKLRASSMVSNLAQGWQQWAKDNEKKQASEPSGWSPYSLEGPKEEPRKTWDPKAARAHVPTQNQPAEASVAHVPVSGKTQKPDLHKETQDAAGKEAKSSAGPVVVCPIKTKQVVKTVASVAQEKSTGIGLLTERITKEPLPSGEEIDRILKKKSSPTLRRKCSNVVSSLRKSWKQVENEQKLGLEEGGPADGLTSGVNRKKSGHPEAEKDRADTEGQTYRAISLTEVDSEESTLKIKRPPIFKKEAEDANKINAFSKKYSAVGNLKSRWQNWASEHSDNQKLNPFSEYFDYDYSMSFRIQKGQEGYGRPKEGSKTAERAKRAEKHIHREMDDMCYVIRTMVDPDPDGKTRVTFGQLFDRYVRISDKVVGILMRARKHGKVDFEGEMLWQGQDDGVIITLLV